MSARVYEVPSHFSCWSSKYERSGLITQLLYNSGFFSYKHLLLCFLQSFSMRHIRLFIISLLGEHIAKVIHTGERRGVTNLQEREGRSYSATSALKRSNRW